MVVGVNPLDLFLMVFPGKIAKPRYELLFWRSGIDMLLCSPSPLLKSLSICRRLPWAKLVYRPTFDRVDRVRMRLGRGSPSTINDHLDAWGAKLGSRLRDLPGHEFPQLPERVAHTLQQLWNNALEGAHQALQDALCEREQTLARKRAGYTH